MSKRVAVISILILLLGFLSLIILNIYTGKPNFITDRVLKSEPQQITEINNSVLPQSTQDEYDSIKIERVLSLNMVGDDVKKAQYILKEKGYYNGEINGHFETALKEAVIQFQRDNGIKQTGNIGPATLTAMTGEKESVDYSKVVFSRDIYPNMTGDDVKKVQYLLGRAGYYKGQITGFYDKNTREAVLNFQRDKKIRLTGNVGSMTQRALEEIK